MLQARIGGFSLSDPCGTFWTPSFLWPNIKLIEDPDAKLAPIIVSEMGLTTRVGQSTQFKYGKASDLLNHSFASLAYRMRATFRAKLDFKRFPYDQQMFSIELQAPQDLRDRVRFVSHTMTLEGADQYDPLWEVNGTVVIDTSVGGKQRKTKQAERRPETVGPLDACLRAVAVLSQSTQETELAELGGLLWKSSGNEYETPLAVFNIQVSRISTYHLLNFLLILSMLVCLSFLTFFISPDLVESRLSLTLTVVLGLNVYQIVVLESMPTTGYVTNMHTSLSTRQHSWSASLRRT